MCPGCPYVKQDGPNRGNCDRWRYKVSCPADEEELEVDEDLDEEVAELDFN